jgi:hypothetical protein
MCPQLFSPSWLDLPEQCSRVTSRIIVDDTRLSCFTNGKSDAVAEAQDRVGKTAISAGNAAITNRPGVKSTHSPHEETHIFGNSQPGIIDLSGRLQWVSAKKDFGLFPEKLPAGA